MILPIDVSVYQLGLWDHRPHAVPRLQEGMEVRVCPDMSPQLCFYGVIACAPMPFYGQYVVELENGLGRRTYWFWEIEKS